jgi:malyl-CoA/(S)-citramalyl-CoA lyase
VVAARSIEIAKGVLAGSGRSRLREEGARSNADGRGVLMLDGKMQDDATWKQCKVMVSLAEMLAKKDPELAKAYGL